MAASALFAASCTPAPSPQQPRDPTKESWYAKTLSQLVAMNGEARRDFQAGKPDDAAALITRGEDLGKKLLSVPAPTLAAAEAASDVDELYGRMLFSNRNFGWARLMFQKNLARWKYWKPPTPETQTRLKQAQSEIAECDRRIE